MPSSAWHDSILSRRVSSGSANTTVKGANQKLTMGPRTSGTSRRSGKPVNKADENNTNNNSISTEDTGTPDTAAKLRNRVLDMA